MEWNDTRQRNYRMYDVVRNLCQDYIYIQKLLEVCIFII